MPQLDGNVLMMLSEQLMQREKIHVPDYDYQVCVCVYVLIEFW